MSETKLNSPEQQGLTDEPVSDNYLQQLQAMEVETLAYPTVPSMLQLNAAKLFRLSDKMQPMISVGWDAAHCPRRFQRTGPAIEAFLKATRHAERHDFQSDQLGKYPGRPR